MRRRGPSELVGVKNLPALLLRVGWTWRKTLLPAVVLAGLLAGGIVSRIPLETDVLKLAPQGGRALRSFETYLTHFGGLDELYIVFETPPDDSIADYELLVERYAELLRASREIREVDMAPIGAGRDWKYLLDRTIFLLGAEGVQEALRRLEPEQYPVRLARTRELLTVPTESVRELVRNDPLGLLRMLEGRLKTRVPSVQFGAAGYISQDGRSRLIIAKPVRPPYDAAFCRQLARRLTEIEEVARAAVSEQVEGQASGYDAARIYFAGAYRASLEAEELIHGEMWRSAVVSLFGILVLLLIVFRSLAVLVCGTLIVGTASVAAFAIAGLAQGGLLAAATGAAAMLFGLGIDGIVLLYSRYLEERANGVAVPDMPEAISGTGASVILANVTSVATFTALVLIDFPSLQELGWLVGMGMLFCCLLTLLLVPGFFEWFGVSPGLARVAQPRLARFIARHGSGIIGSAALLTVVAALLAPHVRLSTELKNLQPDTGAMALNREVMARFGIEDEVLLAFNQDKQLDTLLEKHWQLEDRIASSGVSVSVASAVRLLPPQSEQSKIGRMLASASLSPQEVSSSLQKAAAEAGFRPGVFAPFLDRLPRLLDPSSRLTYTGFLEHDLEAVVSRFIRTTAEGFIVVSYLYPTGNVDFAALERLVHSIDPSFQMTGVPLVNRDLGERFVPEFSKGILIGTLAVVGLLFYVFRSGRLTLLAMIPTVLGLIWTAGLLAALDVQIDLFSAFGIVMVIGISVDYGIHIVHRLASEKSTPGLQPLSHTVGAILIAALTTLIGVGTLIGAGYAPLRSLGIVLVSSILSVLIVSVLVLPALLEKYRWP